MTNPTNPRQTDEDRETFLVIDSSPLSGVVVPDDWRTCRHEWEIYGDGGDLGGNRTTVECRKCQCPGDFDDVRWEVVWPTT